MAYFARQQMILDFHFRGEQAKFEKLYPDLIESAKMSIGTDRYEQLGQGLASVPLTKEDPNYDKLMDKYNAMI